MKHSRNCFTVLTLTLIVFAFWSCATTNTTGVSSNKNEIETTSQIVNRLDYEGQKIDADISSALKRKIAADELISDSRINVDTNHCNITLNGRVDTQAEADRAMKLGRSIKGVRSVHSDLFVKSTTR